MGTAALPFGMPYRINIASPPAGAADLLIQLGALDIELLDNAVAAILPDGVPHQTLVAAFGSANVSVSAAVARDHSSVWLLHPRTVRIGNLLIASPEADAPPTALRLTDSQAFGTGYHPTTALCLEALEEILTDERLESVLDVGTGSGILALAALLMGVPQAVGLDIDREALAAAARNARLNHFTDRLQLSLGGPGSVHGSWPLVLANVLAAPLMEMAPVLVQRVASRGRLILSGIPSSLESEVRQTYQHFGLRQIGSKTRNGWTMLIVQASW